MMVLIGFQAVAFAAFAKVFAIAEGLLPEDPRLDRRLRWGLEPGTRVAGRRPAHALPALAGLGSLPFAGWAQ